MAHPKSVPRRRLPDVLTITAALIRDTFREAFARKIFWGLFGLSTLMILFFLFIMKIDIVEGATATLTLFGRDHGRTLQVDSLVKGVYGSIATFLYTWGMALSVFASSGLIPSVLDPGRIELILSKPVSRAHILLGRFAGNVSVVALNTAYLVLGVWIIFGVKTHIWGTQFLWSIATTIFIFAVLLTVVVLIGVLFESAALATMITVGLMIISPILAQTSMMMRLLSSEASRDAWRVLYQILPKVYDVGRLTLDLVRSQPTQGLEPIYTSALFGAAVLSGALYIFNRRDF
jgi:Cu-processing system permease protein